MTEDKRCTEISENDKEEVTHLDHVPGSALEAIDAKIAHLDSLFKRLMESAAKYASSIYYSN